MMITIKMNIRMNQYIVSIVLRSHGVQRVPSIMYQYVIDTDMLIMIHAIMEKKLFFLDVISVECFIDGIIMSYFPNFCK